MRCVLISCRWRAAIGYAASRCGLERPEGGRRVADVFNLRAGWVAEEGNGRKWGNGIGTAAAVQQLCLKSGPQMTLIKKTYRCRPSPVKTASDDTRLLHDRDGVALFAAPSAALSTTFHCDSPRLCTPAVSGTSAPGQPATAKSHATCSRPVGRPRPHQSPTHRPVFSISSPIPISLPCSSSRQTAIPKRPDRRPPGQCDPFR